MDGDLKPHQANRIYIKNELSIKVGYLLKITLGKNKKEFQKTKNICILKKKYICIVFHIWMKKNFSSGNILIHFNNYNKNIVKPDNLL